MNDVMSHFIKSHEIICTQNVNTTTHIVLVDFRQLVGRGGYTET